MQLKSILDYKDRFQPINDGNINRRTGMEVDGWTKIIRLNLLMWALHQYLQVTKVRNSRKCSIKKKRQFHNCQSGQGRDRLSRKKTMIDPVFTIAM